LDCFNLFCFLFEFGGVIEENKEKRREEMKIKTKLLGKEIFEVVLG